MHAHLDRRGLESIVFSETSAVTLSSCSGAGSLKPLIYEDRDRTSTMTEPLDAELLKDLRGQGKPPSADGNDAEYQEFRFRFRIHMSLVSTVSQPLMDKCEIERNPIFLAAVKALGDAHLKCCIQMYHSLALTTKGNVRSLVRSVEESNGAEAWRLIHNRYAPDTQNRQYAVMQKIMMLAKHWCDHEEGFESGLSPGAGCRRMGTRFWRQMQSKTQCCLWHRFFSAAVCSWVHTPTVPLFEQLCCNGVSLPEILERIQPCQLEMERVQMMTGCKPSLSRKAR